MSEQSVNVRLKMLGYKIWILIALIVVFLIWIIIRILMPREHVKLE